MSLHVRIRRASEAAPFWWDDGQETMWAAGEAAVLTSTGNQRAESIRKQAELAWDVERDHDVPADVHPRFLGGFSFHADHDAPSPWQGFPSARFVLPRRLVLKRSDGTFVIDVVGDGPHPRQTDRAPPDPPEPDAKDAWARGVETARQTIIDGEMSKVVLARCERAPTCDPDAALERLAKQEADSTRFCIRTKDRTFLGATPEWLVRYDGKELTTHALAGTARRGNSVPADDALGRELLTSPKDILEHELVAGFLRERLTGAGAKDVEQGTRRLRRLGQVQHLETPLRARAANRHVLDFVHALHPTPAVCGMPRGRSMDWIDRLEHFPRGWYSGTVGWFDSAGRGKFAVALRCALVTPLSTWLFAGAGIVAGSDPELEWQETDAKLAAMKEAIG